MASSLDRVGIYHGHLLGSREGAAEGYPDISDGWTGDAVLAHWGQLCGPGHVCTAVACEELKTNPKKSVLANQGSTTFVSETSGGANNICVPWGQGVADEVKLEEEIMGTLWREQRFLLRKESDSKHLGAR